MQKNLYLDDYQDQDMFDKLVKVTNIGQSEDEAIKMRDLKTAILTLDNRDIITIEMDNDQEAFIRSYILDEDVAEHEAYLTMVEQDGESAANMSMSS